MKNKIIYAYRWLDHTCWILGILFLRCAGNDVNAASQAWYCLYVHITFKVKYVGYIRPPLWRWLKNKLIGLFGIAFPIGLVYLIIKIIKLFTILKKENGITQKILNTG